MWIWKWYESLGHVLSYVCHCASFSLEQLLWSKKKVATIWCKKQQTNLKYWNMIFNFSDFIPYLLWSLALMYDFSGLFFYYLHWILHELHLIMYFQISRYCTRRNVCFFIRPNLRTGKVDQLPDHLQYSHFMVRVNSPLRMSNSLPGVKFNIVN